MDARWFKSDRLHFVEIIVRVFQNYTTVQIEQWRYPIKADILENHKVHTFYWDNREIETSAEFLEASYYAECQLNNTRPLSHVVQQLQEKSKDLTLKGEKLDLPQEYLYKKILQELLQKHIRFFE